MIGTSPPEPIYLDYNATTYIHEDAAAEMLPYLTTHFGNPSSSHLFGNQSKLAVQKARERVAQMINCQSSEIVFTSGGRYLNFCFPSCFKEFSMLANPTIMQSKGLCFSFSGIPPSKARSSG